jgi:hypothetical protein
MSWRRILGHRFVAVPLAVALLVAGWNIYIAFNAGGIIEGQVRDRAGAPVPGATVIFFERNFVYYQEKQRTTTDARGAYRFDGMQFHVGQLEARTADGRHSERRQLRLWFRAQNADMAPLIVDAPPG